MYPEVSYIYIFSSHSYLFSNTLVKHSGVCVCMCVYMYICVWLLSGFIVRIIDGEEIQKY